MKKFPDDWILITNEIEFTAWLRKHDIPEIGVDRFKPKKYPVWATYHMVQSYEDLFAEPIYLYAEDIKDMC